MYPKLFQIYGPIEINGFNAALMLGGAIALYAGIRHPGRERYISAHDLINVAIESGIVGILGGRLLHVLTEWHHYTSLMEIFSIWNGGLSILGTIIAGLSYAVWTLKRKQVNIAAIFDIASLYTPLVHAFGRIGCFLVGCCHGCETSLFWGITYSNPLVVAPLHIKIHPTQLYSSSVYFMLFLLMRFFVAPRLQSGKIPQGTGVLFYVMGLSIERFFMDFLRGDRAMLNGTFSLLSVQQWIALILFMISAAGCAILFKRQYIRHESF